MVTSGICYDGLSQWSREAGRVIKLYLLRFGKSCRGGRLIDVPYLHHRRRVSTISRLITSSASHDAHDARWE